jgi:hypothetical protein
MSKGDINQRHAGRRVLILDHVIGAEPDFTERMAGGFSEDIVADARHQLCARAHLGCGIRLVGTLAAGVHHEITAQNGLAGQRQFRTAHDHVHIR